MDKAPAATSPLDEQQLRRLVEGSSLAIQVYQLEDPDDLGSFRFIDTNRAAASHAGVPYETIRADLGKTFSEFVPDILKSDGPARYKRVLDTGEPDSWDLSYGDAKYPTMTLRVHAWPLDARTIALAFSNVTAQHQTQRMLDQNIAALQVANQELADSRSRQVQVEKLAALGQMSAGIAHEINNPLLVVKGYTRQVRELLADEELTHGEVLFKCLSRIERSCGRIEAIANRMSWYSRNPDRATESVHVHALLQDVAELMRPQLGAIELVLSLCTEDLVIEASTVRLEQLFVNLILNARDAIADAAHRAGRIEVSSERASGAIALRVRDNGCGMSDRVKGKMFDPFFSTKPPGSGTGLGLTIVHEIAQELGGQVDCATRVGEGTSFTVTVPVSAS